MCLHRAHSILGLWDYYMVHSVLTHRKPTWSLKGEKTAVGPAWAPIWGPCGISVGLPVHTALQSTHSYSLLVNMGMFAGTLFIMRKHRIQVNVSIEYRICCFHILWKFPRLSLGGDTCEAPAAKSTLWSGAALQVCPLWTRAGKLLLLSDITVFIHKGSKKECLHKQFRVNHHLLPGNIICCLAPYP